MNAPEPGGIYALWTIETIATYLAVSTDTALRIAAGDFPGPITLPSWGKGQRRMRRWIAADVLAWAAGRKAENYYDRRPKPPLYPMPARPAIARTRKRPSVVDALAPLSTAEAEDLAQKL